MCACVREDSLWVEGDVLSAFITCSNNEPELHVIWGGGLGILCQINKGLCQVMNITEIL